MRIIHSVCLKNNDRCVGSKDGTLWAVAYLEGGRVSPPGYKKPTSLLQLARLGFNITRHFSRALEFKFKYAPAKHKYTSIQICLLAFVVTLYVMYVSSGSTIFCGLSTVTWVSRRNINFGRKSSSSAAAVVAFAGNDTSWNAKTAVFLQTRTAQVVWLCALTAGVSFGGGATFFFSCTDTSSTAVLRSAIIVPSRSAGGWKKASIRPLPSRDAGLADGRSRLPHRTIPTQRPRHFPPSKEIRVINDRQPDGVYTRDPGRDLDGRRVRYRRYHRRW